MNLKELIPKCLLLKFTTSSFLVLNTLPSNSFPKPLKSDLTAMVFSRFSTKYPFSGNN
jgi:hypothetical protein